jgi:Na+/H+ antiporter NhaD/arsenite permease-like protein
VLLLGGLVAVVLVLTAVLTAPWTPVLVAITLIALVGLVLWWAQRRRERRIDALLEQVAG